MTLRLFDTHAHLNDSQLQEMGEELFQSMAENGVGFATAVGTDLRSSLQCVEIAENNEGVFAAVGVHPCSAHQANDFHWQEILELYSHPKVVAIGETGLDCYWDDCPLPIQKEWFARQIKTSHETAKPLVVHMRESEQEVLDQFKATNDDGRINGIMHSFTGSWAAAETCLEYGMYISFAGMVTFKNAQAIRDVAVQVPNDRILIETDSPYLTPHPHRGKRPNHPALVRHVAECLAELKEMSLEDFGTLTTNNAKRVFQIESHDDVTS